MRFASSMLFVAGCGQAVPSGCYECTGFKMSDFLPADGQRSWTFTSPGLPYDLEATLDPLPAETAPYTVQLAMRCVEPTGCADGPYRIESWSWSSDDSSGTHLHGYTRPNGDPVTFDPPIAVFDEYGTFSDAPLATPEVDGTVWTSTIIDLPGECPQHWSSEWGVNCVHFRLEDGGAGSPLAGDYWAIKGWNIIAFLLTGETQRWELVSATQE